MRLFVYLKNKREERKALREQETPGDKAARVTARATFWMAAFTFVLMLVGVATVWILKNQLQEMQEEQRAWVGVTEAAGDPESFTATEPLIVRLVFTNNGRTPARNVQISEMFIVSPAPILGPTQEQVKELTFRPASSIAPQATFRAEVGKNVAAKAPTDAEHKGIQALTSLYLPIKNKKGFQYYFGILKYDDSFGKTHETQYCVMLANPDTKEVGFCNEFNDLN